MQCPSCAAEVPEGSNFCEQCGTALPRSCPACGHANSAKAKFCTKCGANLASPSEVMHRVPPAAPTTNAPSAERRQLTIMFCDMVGSSALSTRLDPEEQRDVIAAFHSSCTKEIKALGGMVAQYLGDGVLAYFGYPAAHEDDAERAILAGLAILKAIGTLRTAADVAVQTRIAIGSGVVVIGDLAREGVSQENAAIGETTNLVARLQSIAEPNSLVISPVTHRLVGALFEYCDLGRHTLKGFPDPVHVRQVLGPSKIESRFEARHQSGTSPLLGREEELELLLRRWEEAKRGEGRVVLVTGEPGIGKSRLLAALQEALAAEEYVPLIWYCSPQHVDSALYPIITRMERAAGFVPGDGPEARAAKLAALLAPLDPKPEEASLIGDLLGLPAGAGYSAQGLSPQQRRERTLAALLRRLEALAARRPVLALAEDTHWADPTTIELLDLIAARVVALRVLLVVTHRPEFRAPWDGLAHKLHLGRLDRRDSATLIERIASTLGTVAMPPELVEEIVERTDGVPLFAEELTRVVLEAGEGAALPAATSAMPATLHASLAARLDRLGPAVRRAAQAGAAIGREFAHDLLACVADMPEPDLVPALRQLEDADLVHRRGLPLEGSYAFRHALLRDAAYGMLLREQRRALHARIAEAIGRLRPEAAECEPELLAWHCTRAGQAGPAVGHWRRAGEQSIARYANREAIGHFERALEQLGVLAPSEKRDRLEADLRLAQAVPLIAVHGYGAQVVESCASRIKELGDHRPGWAGHFAVHRLVWNSHMLRHPLPRTISLARDLLSFAERSGDPVQTAVACRALGFSLLFAGELVEADPLLARGAIHADGVEATDFAAYGENPSILCRLGGGWVRSLMGSPDTALRMIGEGLTRARASGNPHPISWALGILAVAHKLRCDAPSTKRAAAEAVEVAGQHSLPQWLGFAELWLGWALGRLGQRAEGLALLQVAQRRLRDTGAILFTVMSNCVLAEAGVLAGRPETALEHLAAAQEHAERYGEGFMLAEIHRLHATALCALNAPASECEGRLRTALGIAQRQGAKTWELRAAVDLARLWRDQSRITDAHDVLALVYASFTEGFDLPDLIKAKSLLDELDAALPTKPVPAII
jgi:class 3 adenylate cyclase